MSDTVQGFRDMKTFFDLKCTSCSYVFAGPQLEAMEKSPSTVFHTGGSVSLSAKGPKMPSSISLWCFGGHGVGPVRK